MKQNKTPLFFVIISLFLVFESSKVHSQEESKKSDKYLIRPASFKDGLEKKKNLVVVDLRTPEEYEDSHITGAINIDYKNQNFLEEINKLDKNKKYYIYCRSGGRSAKSRKIMNENNFKKVYDLEGGILAWKKKEYPLE